MNSYEKAVDSLFLREECDVYITGSNAWLLSGELATLLTGRYVELSMMPLSFAEFSEGLAMSEHGKEPDSVQSLPEKFQRYLTTGSFPYVLKLDEAVLKRELAPLLALRDNYPKTLLTLDELFGEMDYDGIQKQNILTWLKGDPS